MTSEETKSGQYVAIKIMRKRAMSKHSAHQARREVAIHKHISHLPGVVTMHHAFEDKDYVYIVLEYCPGGDLFGKVCEEKIFFKQDKLVKDVSFSSKEIKIPCARSAKRGSVSFINAR